MIGKGRANIEITQSQAQKFLSSVPGDRAFWNHDGQIFWNLKELELGLNNMTNEAYFYHCNAVRRDFSTWIREVIGDDQLARDMEKAINRLDAAMIIGVRIAYLTAIR